MLESTFHYLANSKAVLDKMGSSLPELYLVNTILQLQQSYTSVSLLHFHAAELLQLFTLFQAAPIACRQANYRPLAHHESTFIDWPHHVSARPPGHHILVSTLSSFSSFTHLSSFRMYSQGWQLVVIHCDQLNYVGHYRNLLTRIVPCHPSYQLWTAVIVKTTTPSVR